ncbi:MAG: hypothetical protein C0613_02145 [Desulfobulbaceae bacterium]|nr:MAG: hypothetical protein C0613_02145 [Desulfobulbaceae bacterium]
MQERDIRRYHGLFGVILALFILVQVGSGTLIAFNKLAGQTGDAHAAYDDHGSEEEEGHAGHDHDADLLLRTHHNGGTISQLIRVAVGTGILIMVASGSTLYVLTWQRRRRAKS